MAEEKESSSQSIIETQEEIESARGYIHSIQEPNQEILIQNIEDERYSSAYRQDYSKIVCSIRERIKNCLPLKSIEDIENIETRLQCEGFVNEYITFIQIIGGRTPKENICNVLTRMFTNECAMKCSWKGRGQNFAVCKLRLITIMKKTILELHTTFEKKEEFDDIAAEWFKFVKQRHDKELNNSTQ